eukprot:SM000476S16667  [mRNA]  locus=s476:30:1632:- [translate_table: standard]
MRSPSLFRGVMGARLWGSGGGLGGGSMTAPMLVLYLAATLGILSLLTQTLHMLSGGRQCDCAGDGKEAAGGSGQAGVERLLARPALGGGQHEQLMATLPGAGEGGGLPPPQARLRAPHGEQACSIAAAGKLGRDERFAEMPRRAAACLPQDKVTVIISGFSKERIPLMAETRGPLDRRVSTAAAICGRHTGSKEEAAPAVHGLQLVHAYAEMPFVHAVLVLWHNAADPLFGGSDPHNISHLLTDTRSCRPPSSPTDSPAAMAGWGGGSFGGHVLIMQQ